ncbi:arginine ABC transporter permease ArtQ [Endozoicomonas gorgoniicola]|uniref:Arginine ABC transporter permease ArtQ n=1 Tax=Endozoicomonas gorgoniicola TaxID=1234144 RepID=A0ABT3MWQ3_9GAMM|nr:arginine ABC transporter permease ArtQ [Endozoicomonas gorgoniicola]MCW7553807.1 arginine ABC transporter permease ArtQ [Endozoicomonas gorgoniicola]
MDASPLIDAFTRYSGLFLDATLMTLGLALSALGAGLILAMVFALGELSRFRPIAWLTTSVVTIVRGLPELLIIFFVYFGFTHALFLLTDQFIELSPFTAGTIALSLIYSAYASQILRGALLSVARGQKEAARALGIPPRRAFFRIVLPQAWRHALPGLGNQWLVLLKDTALVSLIGINDILRQAKFISIQTYESFTWYCIAALIYLVITLLSQNLLNRMKQHSSRYVREVKA